MLSLSACGDSLQAPKKTGVTGARDRALVPSGAVLAPSMHVVFTSYFTQKDSESHACELKQTNSTAAPFFLRSRAERILSMVFSRGPTSVVTSEWIEETNQEGGDEPQRELVIP